MRLLTALCVLVCGAFSLAIDAVQQERDLLAKYDVVLRNCNDLPAEINGEVVVLAPIICEGTKNVTVTDSAVFDALGLGDSGRMIFDNVHFAIPSNTSAFFAGVTLHFGRDEEVKTEIFDVYGTLMLFADGELLATKEDSPDDRHGMIKLHPGSLVKWHSPITYTKTNITSGKRVTAGELDVTSSRTGATPPTDTRAPEVDCDSDPSPVSAVASEKDGTVSSLGEVKSEIVSGDGPSPAPVGGPSTPTTLPDESPRTDRKTDSDHPMYSREVPDVDAAVPQLKLQPDSRWAKASQAERRRPRGTLFNYKIDVNRKAFTDPHLEYPWFNGLVEERRRSLKVDEELVSPAVLQGVHPSTLSLSLDGSIVHKRPAADDHINVGMKEAVIQEDCLGCTWDVDVGGTSVATKLAGEIGKDDIGVQIVSILETDTKKFAKVIKSRIQKMEKMQRHRRKQRKREHKKKGKVAVAMTEEDMQEEDEADLRQLVQNFKISLKVTDRGHVEAYVDGIRVISESGRKYEAQHKKWLSNPMKALSRRKKSDDYELQVVGDGIQVVLGEELVWAIRM